MSQLFGVLAEFDSPKSLYHVAQKVRDEGYTKWDAFSPFPIHGMDGAMGLKESILGWIVVIGGAVGLSFGFGLQTWVATTAYKIIVSGKPLFSYQAFVPVTFELMVLFSAFAAVFGMFILNRLPQHYHPLFNNLNKFVPKSKQIVVDNSLSKLTTLAQETRKNSGVQVRSADKTDENQPARSSPDINQTTH